MSANRQRRPINLTLPEQVRESLEAVATAKGLSISKIVTALAKIYCELPVDAAETVVETDLKRAMARAHFLAFLRTVAGFLSDDWKAVVPPNAKPGEHLADTWLHKGGTSGLLAFFAPQESNHGRMLAAALHVKAEHHLRRLYIVTPGSETLPPEQRADLAKINLVLVPMAELAAALKKVK